MSAYTGFGYDPEAVIQDADIEMAEFAEEARNVANGVCRICDEALDPFAPKWAKSWSERNTPECVAAAYGPPSPDDPTVHTNCLRDQLADRW